MGEKSTKRETHNQHRRARGQRRKLRAPAEHAESRFRMVRYAGGCGRVRQNVQCSDRLGLGGGAAGSDTLLGDLALVEADSDVARCLGHLRGGLAQQNLGVNRVALVRVDSSVGSVCAAAGLGCLLDDDVADDELFSVQSLGLSVGLGVLQQSQKELDRLDGPSTLSRLELLGLLRSANTTVEAAERNALLLLNNVAEVGVGLLQLHAVDGSSSLPRVLEVNSQVLAAGSRGLLDQV